MNFPELFFFLFKVEGTIHNSILDLAFWKAGFSNLEMIVFCLRLKYHGIIKHYLAH